MWDATLDIPRDEWLSLLQEEQSAVLITLVQRSLFNDCDLDQVTPLALYLSEKLYTNAAEVSIEHLMSGEVDEATLVALSSGTLGLADARELLSALLTVRSFASPLLLSIYARMVRRTFHQLCVDSVRRSVSQLKGCLPAAYEAARNSLNCWAVDIAKHIRTKVIEMMCVSDAQSTPQPLQSDSTKPAVANPATRGLDCTTKEAISVFEESLKLFRDMCWVSEEEPMSVALLTVYGALHNAQAFSDGMLVYGRPELRPPLKNQPGLSSTRAAQAQEPQTSTDEPAINAAGPCFSSQHMKHFTELIRDCVRIIASHHSLFDAVVEWCDPQQRFHVDGSSYLYEDYETGAASGSAKSFELMRRRQAALAQITVFGNVTVQPGREERGGLWYEGAVLLVADILLNPSQHDFNSGVLSSTPAILLSSLTYALSRALQSSSLFALVEIMIFLLHLTESIPRYSITMAGESTEDNNLVLSSIQGGTCASFHSRKYEHYFDVLKQLISVTSLCPNPIHRSRAQGLTVELLRRLTESARIRMCAALIALSPFPSVSRYLLDLQWAELELYRDGNGPANEVFDQVLPSSIMEAIISFALHVKRGNSEFCDPLIAGLNKFSISISNERHRRANPNSATRGKDSSAVGWTKAVERLTAEVLPLIREICKAHEPNATVSMGFLPYSTLSPLDLFSLESAVGSIRKVLAAAKCTE